MFSRNRKTTSRSEVDTVLVPRRTTLASGSSRSSERIMFRLALFVLPVQRQLGQVFRSVTSKSIRNVLDRRSQSIPPYREKQHDLQVRLRYQTENSHSLRSEVCVLYILSFKFSLRALMVEQCQKQGPSIARYRTSYLLSSAIQDQQPRPNPSRGLTVPDVHQSIAKSLTSKQRASSPWPSAVKPVSCDLLQ